MKCHLTMYRCFGDDTTFAPVNASISGKSYVFQFDAFKFVNSGTTDVYLTCNVYVCRPDTATGKCQHPVSRFVFVT